MKLYTSLDKFNIKKGKLHSYLFKITKNTFLNHIKKNKKTIGLNNEISENKNNFIDNLIKEEEELEILKFIDTLPLRDRMAFILNKIQRIPLAEVSQMMNVTKQEVKNKVQRVKNKILKKFDF